MSNWYFALWGGAGGLMVEALQFAQAIKRTGRLPCNIPGEPGPLPLLVSVLIRVGIGFGLTWGAADTHQVSGTLGAIAVGIAAPLVIEQMASRFPFDKGGPPNGGPTRGS